MASQLNPHLLSLYRSLSRGASAIVFAVGFLVLIGWLFDISALKSILPGFATMKVNSALAFLLAGISLWLADTKHEGKWVELGAKGCATLVILIGLLTLSEYAFRRDLGIDELLFKDPLTPENAYPGRMSAVTAVIFSLLGFALLILDRNLYRWPVEGFSIVALLASLLALMGYAFGIRSLYHFYPYSSIAIHTTLAFSILCLGTLFARPEQGLMRMLSSDNAGGALTRRLVPAALLLPFLLGWLLLSGQRMGLYDSTFRLALFALSMIMTFTILIWWNANLLQRADLIRQQAQAQLGQSEEKIAYQAYLLENVNDAVIGSDENSLIRFWNQGAERMFGWKSEEVLGRSGREVLRSEILNTDRETVLKILAERGRWKGESIAYRKDGTPIMIESSTITLRDANRRMTGYVSVNRDVTERKIAEEELHRNVARMRALAELSHALASVHLDYHAVLDIIARRTTELIGDACSIRLVSEDGEWLELASLYHPEPKTLGFLLEILGTNPLRTDTGSIAQIIQTGRPMLIPSISAAQLKGIVPATAWSILEHISIHSLLTVPLRAQGGVLGTLTLIRNQPDHPYTSEDQIFLQDLADRAALAIVNARLYTAMQQLNNELEQRVARRTAQIRESEEKFSKAFLASPAAVSIASLPDGRYINVNEALAKLTGYSREELLGHTSSELGLVDDAARAKILEAIQTHGFARNVEIQIRTKSNRIVEVLTSIEQMELGEQLCLLSVNFDITDRKQAEVEVQKAKMELEAANKELEAFSYSVSHDLRAPLRSIDGYSQALLEDYGELLPIEGRNFLQRVRNSTHRMAELIEDLLNLSQVTRAQIKLVPVDLTRLAENIATELQRTHPERNVRFKVAPNLNVRGDPHLLQVVLENLLNNAWKYTSKQKQAKIEIGSKSENGQTIYFVRDNGAGFDMSYAGKLFGAFQRLHTTTEFPGTGIGLATVQRIIQRHGGRIWGEGAVAQGATFFFTLPALEIAQPKLAPKEKDSIISRAREII